MSKLPNNDFDLKLKQTEDHCDPARPYEGRRVYESSNLKIEEFIKGGSRQGFENIYHIYYRGAFLVEIPFAYDKSLKEQLKNMIVAPQ